MTSHRTTKLVNVFRRLVSLSFISTRKAGRATKMANIDPPTQSQATGSIASVVGEMLAGTSAPLGRYHRGAPTAIDQFRSKGLGKTTKGPGRGGPIQASTFTDADVGIATPGWQSNAFISTHKTIVPLKDVRQRDPYHGQIVFVKRSTKMPTRVRNSLLRRPYQAVNIPQFNYMMHLLEVPEDGVTRSTDEMLSVINQWYFEGVVRTEEGEADNMDCFSGVNTERILNINSRGRIMTPNIWGTNLRPHTLLWLIIKRKVYRPGKERESYVLGPKGRPAEFPVSLKLESEESRDEDLKDATGRFVRKSSEPIRPFRIIPWVGRNNEWPSLKDLRYKDYDGTVLYGKRIRVGRVEEAYEDRDTLGTRRENRSVANIDTRALLAQYPISILVDHSM